jgi:hypothetical protein
VPYDVVRAGGEFEALTAEKFFPTRSNINFSNISLSNRESLEDRKYFRKIRDKEENLMFKLNDVPKIVEVPENDHLKTMEEKVSDIYLSTEGRITQTTEKYIEEFNKK